MTSTGAVATPLTQPGVIARSPSWSPDGEEIAFSCGAGDQADICVIGADGEGFRKLTDDLAEDGEPAWSPDGSKILFSRDSLLGGGVWLMNADGSGQEQIFPGFATSPAWSPDGTKFLMTVTEMNQSDIYIFDFAAAGATNLTESRYWERQPTWRP
jgi:TolB protein